MYLCFFYAFMWQILKKKIYRITSLLPLSPLYTLSASGSGCPRVRPMAANNGHYMRLPSIFELFKFNSISFNGQYFLWRFFICSHKTIINITLFGGWGKGVNKKLSNTLFSSIRLNWYFKFSSVFFFAMDYQSTHWAPQWYK